ncbi:uncharacterized protein LOC107363257 isoform X2 [Tetranychus urticae]|uniref:uncharacterized protein LOC107363257 isoform X2 n=1 Tax=Tetranychus urticae TaxID=32264 RepID=UPI000D654445|nr:uncharacterized protein LOC107363257 isoform X2 [Tetranychus urticae]
MYSLSKGPTTNKVLVKSRRSLPPRMDAFENRGNMKNRRENYPINDISSTRHVYHNSSSGKKTYHHHHYPRESRIISPQHQEMISYIHGNWEGVMRQYESDAQLHSTIPVSSKRLPRVAYYKHSENISHHSPSKNCLRWRDRESRHFGDKGSSTKTFLTINPLPDYESP